MSDFIAAQDRALLESHGLASLDALWALKLEAVDEPNTERGGWRARCIALSLANALSISSGKAIT